MLSCGKRKTSRAIHCYVTLHVATLTPLEALSPFCTMPWPPRFCLNVYIVYRNSLVSFLTSIGYSSSFFMDPTRVTPPPSPPMFGTDSTNILATIVSSPRADGHKTHPIATIAPAPSTGTVRPSAPIASESDLVDVEPSPGGKSYAGEPDVYIQFPETCLPPKMRRKRPDHFICSE